MSTGKSKYVGVDGCKVGWISIGLNDGGGNETKVFEKFDELVDHYQQARLILVDIPIGLPCPGPNPRDCDIEARNRLGRPRGSSVFRVPIREVAYMVSGGSPRGKADRQSRDLNSKGIGAQAFNIMGNIAEVDRVLLTRDRDASPRVREAHPEVCFWGLNGNHAMRVNKKGQAGVDERLRILQQHEPQAKAICQTALSRYLRKKVARDDILDALVAAVTAKLAYQDGFQIKTLPDCPPTDCKGLPVEMVYVEATPGTP